MTLAAGTKVGPSEILAPLGAGGTGEVYRALTLRADDRQLGNCARALRFLF
jgi:hypothetical protein